MAFTASQLEIIQKSRELMPENFSANTTDAKILAYAEVVLSDINLFPPLTGFTTETVPENLKPVLFFGITVMSAMMFQLRATLEDFDYNDNGLSVRVDQVGKIGAALSAGAAGLVQTYRNMIINFKKTEITNIGGKGLGTPRFQSQIGQFLKIALGCFVPNSRVLTSVGFKKISDVKINDFVLSLDGNYHKVYDKIKRNVETQLVVLKLGRKLIKCTPNHEIFIVGKGWVRADHISIYDKVIEGEGRCVRNITKISREFYSGITYDLSVEGCHSYNVEGVIVHNSAFTWNS